MAYLGAFGAPDVPHLARPSQPTIQRFWLPRGDLGIFATLGHMVRLVKESMAHPVVRDMAARVVRGNRPDDSAGNARSIAAHLQGCCPYLRDPFPCEYLVAPWITANRIQADGSSACDCDCVSTYAAALLASIGLRPVFTVLANGRGAPPTAYNHVLTRVWLDGRLVSVDPYTKEGSVEKAVRARDWPIF